MLSNNPSVSFADSSPYTWEPTAAAGVLNGKSLYGTTRLAGGFRFTIKASFRFARSCKERKLLFVKKFFAKAQITFSIALPWEAK